MAENSHFVDQALGIVERAQAKGVYLKIIGIDRFPDSQP